MFGLWSSMVNEVINTIIQSESMKSTVSGYPLRSHMTSRSIFSTAVIPIFKLKNAIKLG